MRGAALVAAAIFVAACGANTTQLTPAQEDYLRAHPERGPRDRNALLYRTIAVGDSFEWVKIAWDGLDFTPRSQPSYHAGWTDRPADHRGIETWEVRVPVDARPVVIRSGAEEEEIPRGRLLLTFRDGKLVSWLPLQ